MLCFEGNARVVAAQLVHSGTRVTEKHYAHSHPHTSPLALADFKPSKIVPIAGRS